MAEPNQEQLAFSPLSPVQSVGWMLSVLENTLHTRKGEWMFFRELRIGTGHRQHELQRLDAFALNCLPHLGMKRICYELKLSRADFLTELKKPLKRRVGMRFSNEFYFVTPARLLSIQDIPPDCGLVEVGVVEQLQPDRSIASDAGFVYVDPLSASFCQITVPAPWRDTPGPTWQFTAAMLRNCQRALQEAPPPPPRQHKLELA